MKRTIFGLMVMMIIGLCASSVATYGCSIFMDDRAMMVADNTIPDAMSGRIKVDHKDLITDDVVVVDEPVITTSSGSDTVSVVPVDVPDFVTVAAIPIDATDLITVVATPFDATDLITVAAPPIDEVVVVAAPVNSTPSGSESELVVATPAGSESNLVVATPVSDFTDPVGIFKEADSTPVDATEEKFIIPVEPVYNVAPKFDLVNAVPVENQASSPVRFIAGNGINIQPVAPISGLSSRIESDPVLSGRYSGEDVAGIPRVQFSTSRTITVGDNRHITSLIGNDNTLDNFVEAPVRYAYPVGDGMEILADAS